MTTGDVWTLLRQAGWSESRSVRADADFAALSAAGYAVSPAAAAIVQNVRNLVVRFTRNGNREHISLAIARAASLVDKAWIDDYSQRASVSLLPAGFAFEDHMVLVFADDDRWFGGYDDTFGMLGVGFVDMISNVVNGVGFVPAP
jgi:hypothetical protein